MPLSVKISIGALLVSCFFTILGWYLESLEFEALSFKDPFNILVNALWVAVVLWLVSDICKKKEGIIATIAVVSVISVVLNVYDFFEYGFGIHLIMYTLELLMFGVAIIFLCKQDSRKWRQENDL